MYRYEYLVLRLRIFFKFYYNFYKKVINCQSKSILIKLATKPWNTFDFDVSIKGKFS